jgi:hypothetical protein
MIDIESKLRAAIQAVLDADDSEGWSLAQFTVAMGVERIGPNGLVESASWLWSPPEQAEWMTAGLLEAAIELRACADMED